MLVHGGGEHVLWQSANGNAVLPETTGAWLAQCLQLRWIADAVLARQLGRIKHGALAIAHVGYRGLQPGFGCGGGIQVFNPHRGDAQPLGGSQAVVAIAHIDLPRSADLAVGIAPHLDDVLGVRIPALNALKGVAELLAGRVDVVLVLEHPGRRCDLAGGQHLPAHHPIHDWHLAISSHGAKGIEHVRLAQLTGIVNAGERLGPLPQRWVGVGVEQWPKLVILAAAQLAHHRWQVVICQPIGRRQHHAGVQRGRGLNLRPGLECLVDPLHHWCARAVQHDLQLVIAELLDALAQCRALRQFGVVIPRPFLAWFVDGAHVGAGVGWILQLCAWDRLGCRLWCWGRGGGGLCCLGVHPQPLLHGGIGLLEGRFARCRRRRGRLHRLRCEVQPIRFVLLKQAHRLLLGALPNLLLHGAGGAGVAADVAESGSTKRDRTADCNASGGVGDQRLHR